MAQCALVLASYFEKYNDKVLDYGLGAFECGLGAFECGLGVGLIWNFDDMIFVRNIICMQFLNSRFLL